jgi:hypothetical protein
VILSQWAPANIYEYSYDNFNNQEDGKSKNMSARRSSTNSMNKDLKYKAQSGMGRALLIAEYFIQAKHKCPITGEEEDRTFPLYIANSHFESLDGPSI